jgi:hypothetical protein
MLQLLQPLLALRYGPPLDHLQHDRGQRKVGDELRRFAEQRSISKPELAEALGKLRAFQRRVDEHFRTTYLHVPRQARQRNGVSSKEGAE